LKNVVHCSGLAYFVAMNDFYFGIKLADIGAQTRIEALRRIGTINVDDH
jgi:hypothetical protein